MDPQFKSQFVFNHCTPKYSRLLRQLPEVFVGAVVEVIPLVELLCEETEASFRQAGLTMPSWRQAQAMLARWLPQQAQDIKVPAQEAQCTILSRS